MDDRYDVIVIGSGAGGLTAGLQSAWHGKKAIVLERQPHIGGFSRGEHQDGYIWDHGGHLMFGLHPGGYLRGIFDHFGITELVDPVAVEDNMRAIFSDRQVFVPLDRAEFQRVLSEEHPRHRPVIGRFLDMVQTIAREVMSVAPVFQVQLDPPLGRVAKLRSRPLAKRAELIGGIAVGKPGRRLLRHANQTINDLLDQAGVEDPSVRNDLSLLTLLFGTPPDQISAVGFSIFYESALQTQYMPRLGYRTIAEALERRFTEVGGTVRTSAPVAKILLNGKRATGVELADGERILGDAVIADVSPLIVLDLVGDQNLPDAYVRRIRAMRPGPPIFQVYLGSDVTIPEGTARLTGLFGPKGTAEGVSTVRDGKVTCDAMSILVSPLSHPDYAPAESGSYKLEMFVPYAAPGLDWDAAKDELADRMIAQTERVLPGISSHIEARIVRSPLDVERDSGSPRGSALAWEMTPDQSGTNRTSPVTPIADLYLAGQWTQPGPGVAHVVLSGLYTANLAMTNA